MLQGVNSQIWKFIWALSLLPKVLNFVWRACLNILPVSMVLEQRRIETVKIYPVGNQDEETIIHCILHCQYARDCWLISRVGWRGQVNTFQEWFLHIQQTCDLNQLEEALLIAWEIWNARNKVFWHKKQQIHRK